MLDLIFVLVGVGAIVAYLIASLVTASPSAQPPQIIYVQALEAEPRRQGCLPFIAGVVTLIALGLLGGW